MKRTKYLIALVLFCAVAVGCCECGKGTAPKPTACRCK